MKTHLINLRILFAWAVLLGMGGALRADVTGPPVVISQLRARVEKKTGFLSRLFGSKTEKAVRAKPHHHRDNDDDDDDDEDDDDERDPVTEFRPPSPGSRVTVTRITTTETRRGPAPVRYWEGESDPQTQTSAPSTSGPSPSSVAREGQTGPQSAAPSAYLDRTARAPRGDAPKRPTLPPAPAQQNQVAPTTTPPPATSASPRVRNPSPASPRKTSGETPATSTGPTDPPDSASASPSSPEAKTQNTGSIPTSEGPASPTLPVKSPSDAASQPPFARAAPGRPGFVYPPGKEARQENLVDVTGYAPGTKVRDPDTKIMFRVP